MFWQESNNDTKTADNITGINRLIFNIIALFPMLCYLNMTKSTRGDAL
jgi:hypothetical protein